MGQDKVMELIEKCRELGSTRELIKGIEILIEIILRNRQIPYGYNSDFNEVKQMRSFLSERTKTETSIESVKIQSVYQSASPIAQDISFQPRNKRISFCSILSNIVKADVVGVEGIRICCSGRSEGAEISRTECGKYGKTSRNVLEQKIDYAPAPVSTRYGILGVKVWISYREKKRGRALYYPKRTKLSQYRQGRCSRGRELKSSHPKPDRHEVSSAVSTLSLLLDPER
jgi:small subunit ribosomal protein S3